TESRVLRAEPAHAGAAGPATGLTERPEPTLEDGGAHPTSPPAAIPTPTLPVSFTNSRRLHRSSGIDSLRSWQGCPEHRETILPASLPV
ncbi:MAG TPA: hypothetical protein VE173_13740, partial [Longimicrobiales bacterium]|nr:hypothetical protein [Longimicrobiales bacterium]